MPWALAINLAMLIGAICFINELKKRVSHFGSFKGTRAELHIFTNYIQLRKDFAMDVTPTFSFLRSSNVMKVKIHHQFFQGRYFLEVSR